MTITSISVDRIPALGRQEAAALGATENDTIVDLVRSLDAESWSMPTDCPDWDVRAMAAHVLGGMEAFGAFSEFVHQMRAGRKAAGDGPFIDGMTAVQVRERASLSREALVDRLVAAAPRAAHGRRRVPGVLRRLPMKQEVGGATETWRLGYLLDVILTRDTWMHRVDLARATGRVLVLSPEHDGRIVAGIVAEWARRHAQPFTLHLEGPAGGSFAAKGGDGEQITLDAVEFCRTLSGRAIRAGLLTQEVPF